jgi:D-serine deaminase-like pyridoxal phosphate-dependent protein
MIAMIAAWQDRVRKAYSSAVGRSRHDLVTPALVLDLDVARRNLQFMTERLLTLKAKLRPHVKC